MLTHFLYLFSFHPLRLLQSCRCSENIPTTRFPHRVQTDPEGTLWQDPPNYWENIVWPAYVDAHKGVFENGDVEHGKLTGGIEDLVLLETLEISMTEAVERCCQVIHGIAQEAYGAK